MDRVIGNRIESYCRIHEEHQASIFSPISMEVFVNLSLSSAGCVNSLSLLNLPARPGHRSRRPSAWLILALCATAGWLARTGQVRAEGSRTLYPASYPSAGFRANIDYSAIGSLFVNKVRRRQFLYVYAQAGEYIVLGSRNRSDASLNDISVYNPQSFGTPGDETVPGTADFTCSGGSSQPGPHYSGGTTGTITTRAQELAGPNSADNSVTVTNGFQPCAYKAPLTGIYGVVFTGTILATTTPDGVIDPPGVSTNSVSVWDVTVRASATSTTDINGRLFTFAFLGFTGGNPRPVHTTHYYVTNDGYRYQQDLRGLDPNGYALYANPLGFLDNLQPLYKDIRGAEGVVTTTPPGVTTQTAQYPIFFGDVSPTGSNATEVNRVLSALGIRLTPAFPTLSKVSFIGLEGGPITPVGAGGTFTFTTTQTITYLIVISRDGVDFDPGTVTNGVLTGIAGSGTHSVVWDGKDGTRSNFPASTTPYRWRMFGRAGEVHFPIIDAENNAGGGPTITRLNGSGAPDKTVFYDDRGYVTSSGTVVGVLNGTLCPTGTPAAPGTPVSLLGVDSSTSYRAWASGLNVNTDCASTAGWGDAKGINLWTYFSTPPQNLALLIVPIIVDPATSASAPASAVTGSTVQGAFNFTNNGNTSALGVTYGATLTPGLGTVTFGNLPSGVTASYDSGTGVITLTGLPTTLTAGQTVSATGITFSYTAPATGPVILRTTVSTTSVDNFLPNNTATVSTGVGAVDVLTTVGVPVVAVINTVVNGNIVFANFGGSAAAGMTYAATIGSSSNSPASVTFTNVPAGTTASYNPTTRQVTFTGMPSTLAFGQSLSFDFIYTAQKIGVVPVNTSITTTSGDAVPSNNSASGSTAVSTTDPDVTPIPTLGAWGLLALVLLMVGTGVIFLRRAAL